VRRIIFLVFIVLIVVSIASCNYTDNTPMITYSGTDEDNNGFNPNNPIFDNLPRTTPTTSGYRDNAPRDRDIT
jgi:hypothetical protein